MALEDSTKVRVVRAEEGMGRPGQTLIWGMSQR